LRDENYLKLDCCSLSSLKTPPTFKFSPYNVWKWFNGDRFKLIGVKLQEGFSLDLREHSIFRKMAKVSEKFRKIYQKNKNSLRSVFIAAWPELVQFNCGNFLVCLCWFFSKTNKKLFFVCFWKLQRQILVSRPKYWLWLAVAALGYSMEMRDIFFQKKNYSGICSWSKYLFLFATQINSNSWFRWVF